LQAPAAVRGSLPRYSGWCSPGVSSPKVGRPLDKAKASGKHARKAYDPYREFAVSCRIAGLLAAGIAGMVFLMACSDAKPVSYYKGLAAADRKAKVESCVASGSDSQDCLNARQAEFEVLGITARDGRALSGE
jgi:hypothetical protein